MPYKPNKPCAHPGCPKLVSSDEIYCEEHQALHPKQKEQRDRWASNRGYNRQWQKASKAFLRSHPLCVKCKAQGRYVKATVVDHIEPHCGDYKLFWDQDNWQPLCKHCHDVKTMTEDKEKTRRPRVYSY